jgi:hypothetical protein
MKGKKMTPTRHYMVQQTALARHPEAVRVPGSMQLRSICTTEEHGESTGCRPLDVGSCGRLSYVLATIA